MILKAKQLYKTYGNRTVLKGIDLNVELGQTIAIVGRSGEGKTTLLHVLSQLETPDKGLIEIGGKLLTPSNAHLIRKEHIGFIFQSYNLLEDFTCLENVLMPARIARKPIHLDRGFDLLNLVGLKDKAHMYAKNLSGGERQRVAIARALCNDPSLIFADEPTGNLDRANAERIGSILKELKKSLILVTHDALLASTCMQRYELNDGSLKLLG